MPSAEARWDLIVVGGGPAGATLATLVKKYNPTARVLVLEKEAFPRHHIGESLLPAILPVLKDMGVYEKVRDAGFLKKIGVTFVWGRDRRPWDADFSRAKFDLLRRHGIATDLEFTWQVVRSKYDAMLLSHARESGVVVWKARAAGVLRRGGAVTGLRVEKDGRRLSLAARLVADCSGQNGFLSSAVRTRLYRPSLENVAAYAYFKGARWKFKYLGHPDKTRLLVCSVPEGWIWYIPISRDAVSVGLVAKAAVVRAAGAQSLESFFEGALSRCREVAPLLRGAKRLAGMDRARPEKAFFSAQDWSFTSGRACGPGWLAAGDAAFFIDPLLSSGVMMAHYSAQRAAYAVTTSWAAGSPAVSRRVWRHYDLFCKGTADHFLKLVEFWYHHDPNAAGWRRLAGRALRDSAPVELGDEGAFAAVIAGLTATLERLYCGALGAVQPNLEDSRRLWTAGEERDLPVPYLFLDGANRSSWQSERERGRPRRTGLAVGRPRWVRPPSFSEELVPIEGAGVLRPIAVLAAERRDGGAARRLLPWLHVRLLKLIDGRRSVDEIEALAAESCSAPREEIARQWRGLLLDLGAAGVLELSKDSETSRPPEARGALRRAEALVVAERWAEAERLLSSWRGLRTCAWGLALRGEARRRLGALAEAEADLDAALSAAPRGGRDAGAFRRGLYAAIERGWVGSRALAWRALARLEAGRPEQALHDADAALSLDPRSFDARRARAAACARLGRVDEARRDQAEVERVTKGARA